MRLISASILDFDQDAIGYTRAERLGLDVPAPQGCREAQRRYS
jgi:hypothetical protein